ncbi:MAG: response regulator, partial [Anaerolineae bacterium]|nr:response regulator [Anaerolineae bacterium]
GTMWVKSKAGQGSTFYFTIVSKIAPEQKSIFIHPDHDQLAQKRVLIVDDNQTCLNILNHQVQSWGMISMAVSSGAEALQYVQNDPDFDLAIIDMQMPEMDGAALVRELRAIKPIATVMLAQLGHSLNKGIPAAAYITKPIKPVQLYSTLINLSLGKTSRDTPLTQPLNFDRTIGQRFPLRILLAEDNVVNQKVALSLLARVGYRADVAANGLEVLAALKRLSYDVVLMDVQMPEMDGLEATRQIRAKWPTGQQPRIIAMTANALAGDREKYLALGMDDYVGKPIRIEQLIVALTKSVEGKAGSTAAATDPPPNESALTQAIDMAVLDEFEQMMGEDGAEMVMELIDIFLEETPELLESLQMGLKQDSPEQVRKAAHSLKSSAANLGAVNLSSLCRNLESSGRAGLLDVRAGQDVNAAVSEFEVVKQILTTKRNALATQLTPSSEFLK